MINKHELISTLSALLELMRTQRLLHSSLQPIVLKDLHKFLPFAVTALTMLKNDSIDDETIRIYSEDFFMRRWEQIRGTVLCYTVNSENLMSIFCRNLSQLFVDSLNIDRNQALTKNSMLMPTVTREDIYFNDIDELELGSFILSDDSEKFISIKDWADYTIKSMLNNGNLSLKVYDIMSNHKDKDGYRPLTMRESKLLSEYSSKLRNIYYSLPRSNLLEKLQCLYRGLLAGSVVGRGAGRGTETIAGEAASVAIAEFFSYFNNLHISTRSIIRGYRCGDITLGSILDTLNYEYRTSQGDLIPFCVKLISNKLNSIIESNQADMRKLPVKMHKDNLLKMVIGENGLASRSWSLTPGEDFVTNRHTYREYCKDEKLIFDNMYERVLSLLHNFVCGELDRLALKEPESDKINYYLATLIAVMKEWKEFSNRPEAAKKAVLEVVMARIYAIADIRRNFSVKMFTESKDHYKKFFNDNKNLFNTLNLNFTPGNELQNEVKTIFKNQRETSRLYIIESQAIARLYVDNSPAVSFAT